MRRTRWIGVVACCVTGIACGGGGGGQDVGQDAGQDAGPDREGVTPLDTPSGEEVPTDAFEAEEGVGDLGVEVLDAGEAGPDTTEVPACGETCSVTNEHGTCKGWRPCVDGGLGECDARTPEAEVCDGVDNDCDGETDEDGAALCDDGVACTADRCDGEAGCAHPIAPGACLIAGECYEAGDISPHNECLFCWPDKNPSDWSPRPGGCDDGNVCTKRDTCEDGVCVGKENVCECEKDDDCAPHEDENPCNGTLFCDHGTYPAVCVVDPATVVTCDASHDTKCLANLCNPATGACEMTPVFEGTTCDDGEACTKEDRCVQGTCAGESYSCDDGLPCTQDRCDGAGGCDYLLAPYYCVIGEPGVSAQCVSHGEHHPDNVCLWCNAQVQASGWSAWSGPCDDGEACTLGDTCVAGTCAGEPFACDDGLDCTVEACDGLGGCVVVEVAEGFCLIDGACVADGEHHPDNECLWCDPSADALAWTPNDLPCEDGDACTSGDLCVEGVCVGGDPRDCDDGDVCTDDSCDPETGECANDPNQAPCDDEDPCTTGDVCGDGACAGEPYTCDDGLDCTVEACDGLGGCEVVEVAQGSCLIDGACVAAFERNPDNECLWCDPDKAIQAWSPHDLSCQDGNPCTTGDRCVRGVCVGGPPPDCDDGHLCTDDRCDPDAGGCVHVNNTVPCDDGNPCTVGDACAAGDCTPGRLNACECESDTDCPDDGDKCNGRLVCDTGVYPHVCVTEPGSVVTCDASGDTTCRKNQCNPATGQCEMTPVNEGAGCNDENPCTHGETCVSGVCLGTAYDCDDGRECTDDVCRGDGTCEHALEDGFCLIAGACVNSGVENGDNPCLVCDPTSQKSTWTPKPNGTPCDDEEACTHSDACKAGQCRGVAYGCDDLLDCTVDACLGDGTCSHVIAPHFCVMDGVCKAHGDMNGPCLTCDPDQNPTGWTVREGAACDDGVACTKDDQCDGSGACSGTPYECDDGLECTLDICLGDGQCDFATIVDGACLIDGKCYGRGDEDPQDPCRRCWPEASKTAWTPRSDGSACSDGNECTVNDRCQAGSCVPGPARVCDDHDPCTNDRCEPETGCVFEGNDLFRVDFEDLSGFTFENSHPDAGWQVIAGFPGHPSAFLYYGNPEAGNYDTPGSANHGTAWSEDLIQIASGQPAFLSFDLRLDNEWSNALATGGEGRQWNDVLEVVLSVAGMGEMPVWSSSSGQPQWWVSTSGGTPVRAVPVRVSGVDLASQLQWWGYPPFRLGFRFQTGDERMNDFSGVFVDNVVIGTKCDDGDACTTGESCQAGQCLGLPAVCDDVNDCTEDSCDPGWGCQHTPANDQGECEDFNLCTDGTTCNMGWCGGGTPVVCEDDGNDCTSDACAPLKGCAYTPVSDFSECSQADPYGTCLQGVCVAWDLNEYLDGDYATGFYAVERVPGGPLSVAGVTDPPNDDGSDPTTPAVFELDAGMVTWSPLEEEGELWAIAGGLAAGYEFDAAEGLYVPRSAWWDPAVGGWNFDPGVNPIHVPADGNAGLFAVTRSPGSGEFFLGGIGRVGDITSYLERCAFDPMSGAWLPCEAMAAFADPWSCEQVADLVVYSMWAAGVWSVWLAGESLNPMGESQYTILHYDGNGASECGGVSGFRGVFTASPPHGLSQGGPGALYGIHGSNDGNVWAVGSEGKVFAWSSGAFWGWQEMRPADHGIAWDTDHTGYAVFVEDRDVHIVGTLGDQVPFYLHARRTDNWWNPWVFDRKIEFWDFASDHAGFYGVTRDPQTGAIEAVGTMYDPGTDMNYGIRARITAE